MSSASFEEALAKFERTHELKRQENRRRFNEPDDENFPASEMRESFCPDEDEDEMSEEDLTYHLQELKWKEQYESK